MTLILPPETYRRLEKKIGEEETKELATKADIVKLEGKIDAVQLALDRKFMIMFLILFFTTIFVNQNALKFMAELLGLIKP